jgi:hypothetical protein
MLSAAKYKSVATRCGLNPEEYVHRIERGLKRCSRCGQWLLVEKFIRKMCNLLKRAYDADEWLDYLAAIVARHRRCEVRP